MNAVDMERCKRIVQYIWDPAPRNDQPGAPIWCLGTKYTTDGMERDNRHTGKLRQMKKSQSLFGLMHSQQRPNQ